VTKSEFRLACVPGVAPGKWARVWVERVREVPLRLIQMPAAEAVLLLRDVRPANFLTQDRSADRSRPSQRRTHAEDVRLVFQSWTVLPPDDCPGLVVTPEKWKVIPGVRWSG
jgi:hypothetical protein